MAQGSISGQGFNAGDVLAGSLGDAIGSGVAEEAATAHESKATPKQSKTHIKTQSVDGDFNLSEIEAKLASQSKAIRQLENEVFGWGDETKKPALISDDVVEVGKGIYDEAQNAYDAFAANHPDLINNANLAYDIGKTFATGINAFGKGMAEARSEFYHGVVNRGLGALRLMGGIAEMGASMALIAATEGFGAVPGYALALHGSDEIATGLRELYTGKQSETLTHQGMVKAGAPPIVADLAEMGIGLGGFSKAMRIGLGVSAEAGVLSSVERVEEVSSKVPNKSAPVWKSPEWYEDVALNATRNAESDRLVLGHFAREGKSYQRVASHYDATYFKVENWNEVTKGLSETEIWNINEAFLDQQVSQGKQILFSHNPLEARSKSFFEKEVNYLKAFGYKFEQKNQWTWEAVLK